MFKLTLESLSGAGVPPQPLRFTVEDPRLVLAAGVVIRVQEDAANQSELSIISIDQSEAALPVRRLLQLVFLPQDPVKL